jgi:hypothetical protein
VIDEIPSTLGFNSRMFQAKDVESPNSHVAIERFLDEIPLTSGFDSRVPRLLIAKVNPFHMIFDLHKVLITTHFDRYFHCHFPFWIKGIFRKMTCSIPNVYLVCSPIYNYFNQI